MITIINYGLGNVHAFVNAYKFMGVDTVIANDPSILSKSSRIILPGVGSYDHAIEKLNSSGMRDKLEYMVINKQIPLLGICVGMQILGEFSDEGDQRGLGWINGCVKKIDDKNLAKPKLPHMGWNFVNLKRDNSLTGNLDNFSKFYFLHSYYFEANNENDIITTTTYGKEFTSALNKDNIYGVQFHPEKSHDNGLQILKNFLKI